MSDDVSNLEGGTSGNGGDFEPHFTTFNPAAIGTDNGTDSADGGAPEPPVRKRKPRSDAGIPRGSRGDADSTGTRKKGKGTPLDLSALTGMFVGVHTMLAMKTGIEEIAITEEEGGEFMKRAQNVMRHYDVATTQKTLDWIAFYGCCVGMYGPRALVCYMYSKGKHPSQMPQTGPGNMPPGMIYPFPAPAE